MVTITLSAAPSYDVTADEDITVTVPASALVTSSDPVTGSPAIAVVADVVAKKGGRAKRKGKKRRYLVEIDNQFFDADNIAAVQAVLSQAIDAAPQAAKQDADKAPVRIKPPRIAVTTGSGAQTTSRTLQRSVRAAQERVNAIYRQAQRRVTEIREMAEATERARENERREEEAILSLLL